MRGSKITSFFLGRSLKLLFQMSIAMISGTTTISFQLRNQQFKFCNKVESTWPLLRKARLLRTSNDLRLMRKSSKIIQRNRCLKPQTKSRSVQRLKLRHLTNFNRWLTKHTPESKDTAMVLSQDESSSSDNFSKSPQKSKSKISLNKRVKL